MSPGNRFLLVIYALVTTILAASAMLWLADFSWFVDFASDLSQQDFFWQIVWLVLVVYVLAGLHFIWAVLVSSEENHLIISNQEMGQVRIVPDAVEDFTQKILLHKAGVKTADTKLKIKAGAIQIRVRIAVAPELSIPNISSELQEEIKTQIKEIIGLEIQKLEILVQKISSESPKA